MGVIKNIISFIENHHDFLEIVGIYLTIVLDIIFHNKELISPCFYFTPRFFCVKHENIWYNILNE